MKDPREKSDEFPKPLVARVVAVGSFDNSPIQVALVDGTGAMKLLWYTNASTDIAKIKSNLVPEAGVVLTGFRLGSSMLIGAATTDAKK